MWFLQLHWPCRAFYPKELALMALAGRRLFLDEFLSEGSARSGRENSDKGKTNRELKDYLTRTTHQ